MSGTIELDRDRRHLLISFPYDEQLVDVVRGLPGRRWDRGRKAWMVPAAHAEQVVSTLDRYHFQVQPDVWAIYAGTATVPEARAEDEAAPEEEAEDKPLSISKLNEKVRDALSTAFPGRVQVVGEVLDYDKNKDRRHVFFTLVEKGGDGQSAAARVDVAMFERTARREVDALAAKGLELRDGLEILIEARLDFYPKTGRFQLILETIRPEFTLGKLALGREQILAELRDKDLDRKNLALPLPIPPLRVGVLTSPDSDGWNDFKKELEASGIGFDLRLYPVKVQGEELQPTMLAGLRWFADRSADFDALCIVRGGGSRSDLAWFDNREVALAVANHPLKVICGIGHERDSSVLDEISLSLKTPTAAAGFLVAQWSACDDLLREHAQRLRELAREALRDGRDQLNQLGQRLHRLLHARIVGESHRLGSAARRLALAAPRLLRDRRRALDDTAARTAAETRSLLRAASVENERRVEHLERALRRRLENARAFLHTAETRQRLLDPRRVLTRGYAILRDANSGKIITDTRHTEAGALTELTLRDGKLRARIESVETEHGDTQED